MRRFGFVERFHPGEHKRVVEAAAGMRAAGATMVRTPLSWEAYCAEGGEAWFDWLLAILGRDFEVLPFIHRTPAALSRNGRGSGAPRRLADFADFVELVLSRHGAHFRHIELWTRPTDPLEWDRQADPEWRDFCEMAGGAAERASRRGWKVVLAGPSACEPDWLTRIAPSDVLAHVDALGIHAFPGTWDSEATGWQGFAVHIDAMRSVLHRCNPETQLWLTQTGYATWRHDEAAQLAHFRRAENAPADRFYWSDWQDSDEPGLDIRLCHLGVSDSAGRPKLLRRALQAGGAALATPVIRRRAAPVIVLGGAGFIGSNLADSFLGEGRDVVVFDSLKRPGVERNLAWLADRHGARMHPMAADIRDRAALREAVTGASAVFHLAAQVAVTSSLVDPRDDFAVNAEGTLNVLEAVRNHAATVPIVFASTNKVYGQLADVAVAEIAGSLLPQDNALRALGVDESRPLDFCTPYGCSKGSADQYVRDYAHSFGLRTAVLRMSCIYGPRQFGTEDQGWVAHFLIRALCHETITIFGNGRQVRDILHVGDAVSAYRAVLANIDALSGQACNLGGGPDNAVSLGCVLAEIEALLGRPVATVHAPARQGDQPYFVADTRRLREAVGWRPRIAWRDGIRTLADWLRADLALPDGARKQRALA